MIRSISLVLAALLLLLTACSAGTPQPNAGGTAAPLGAASTRAILDHELIDVRSGDAFTLRQLASDKPVLLETIAIWCTTCLAQQREVVRAHGSADFHAVGIDVDPNERPDDLARYAEGEGFDWRFAMADAELVKLLTDAYGFGVTNPPSTPTFVIGTDGRVRALEFGRVRSAEELVTELGAG
ncbi:MAG: TlpA family protein disulfide reductase [Chloroflexota bacterium]